MIGPPVLNALLRSPLDAAIQDFLCNEKSVDFCRIALRPPSGPLHG